MGMNFDVRGINHQPFHISVYGQDFIHRGPYAFVAPATKPAMSVFPVAVIRRQVPPGRPRSQYPEDCIDKQAIIAGYPAPLTFTSGKQWLNASQA